MPIIQFVQVKSNQEKLVKICGIVQHHFEKKERLLIAAANKAAADYVDDLLWKMPQEGFLPHQFSDIQTSESIVITTQAGNLNNATILLNLLPIIHPHFSEFKMVYEIYDLTDSTKETIGKEKLEFYRAKGLFK